MLLGSKVRACQYKVTIGVPSGVVMGRSTCPPEFAARDTKKTNWVRFRIVLRAESNLNQMLQCIMDAGLTIRSINPDRKHLNQAFMDLTRGGVA